MLAYQYYKFFSERWVVANDTLPWMNKLFIYGTLEIDDSKDMVINATYILIQGGRLIAGFNETRPFTHDLRILLNGHHFTQDIPLPNGPNLGSKALGRCTRTVFHKTCFMKVMKCCEVIITVIR